MNLPVNFMHWGDIADVPVGKLFKYLDQWHLRVDKDTHGPGSICLTGEKAGIFKTRMGVEVFYIGCDWVIEATIPSNLEGQRQVKRGDLILSSEAPFLCAVTERQQAMAVNLCGEVLGPDDQCNFQAPAIPNWTAVAIGPEGKRCELFKVG